MSYARYAEHRVSEATHVPFGHFVAPFGFVGEAIYTAFEGMTDVAKRAFGAFQAKTGEREAVRALVRLDDRTLRDIGVQRAQVRYIAKRTAENPDTDYREISS
jgi:uncharacterized protein YjiS (DUF1127 family)